MLSLPDKFRAGLYGPQFRKGTRWQWKRWNMIYPIQFFLYLWSCFSIFIFVDYIPMYFDWKIFSYWCTSISGKSLSGYDDDLADINDGKIGNTQFWRISSKLLLTISLFFRPKRLQTDSTNLSNTDRHPIDHSHCYSVRLLLCDQVGSDSADLTLSTYADTLYRIA